MSLKEKVDAQNAKEAEERKARKGAAPDVAESEEQPQRTSKLRRNPEIDTRIDAFIVKNPGLYEYYRGFTPDESARQLAYYKMLRVEYQAAKNKPIMDWVEATPGSREIIEKEIENVHESRRESAFINSATRLIAAESAKAKQSAQKGVGV